MKPPLVLVVFLALVTSIFTVGLIELLFTSRPTSQPVQAIESPARPPAASPAPGTDSLVPVPTAREHPALHEERLAELERRILALESERASRRTPLPLPAGGGDRDDALLDLVLDRVSQERETSRRAAELAAAEERRKELETNARRQAHFMAQEHGLSEWEEAQLADVFLVVETRREEVERETEGLTEDASEWEARWVEFDEWADRTLRDELGEEQYDRLYPPD